MQKLLLLFITCLPFCLQAQSPVFKINNNTINKIELDEINLLQIKPTADGKTNFYFDIEKKMILVDKKKTDVKLYKNVKGIAVITLDAQNKKSLEQVILFIQKKRKTLHIKP